MPMFFVNYFRKFNEIGRNTKKYKILILSLDTILRGRLQNTIAYIYLNKYFFILSHTFS